MPGNWKELYAEELKRWPKIAELLSDGDRLLDLAQLTRDEREAWKLKGLVSTQEIATLLKRQKKTVLELIRRAEFKLATLKESLAEPEQKEVRTLVRSGQTSEHTLLSGPCSNPSCSLLHWFCSCGHWTGSTVLNAEANRQEWEEEHCLEVSTQAG